MNGATKARARMTLGALLFGSSFLLSACLKSTEPQASLLDLGGTWHYTGVQAGAVREALDGTLAITRESGMSFQGLLILQALNEQTGLTRQLSGVVSGSESGIDVIDFDADIEGITRRHVGTIAADTIAGNWISAADATVSGTFRVVRETR
jgi:hypothetical protein